MNQKILHIMAVIMDAGYHSLPSTSPTQLRFARWDGTQFVDEVAINIDNPVLPEKFQVTRHKQQCDLAQPKFDANNETSPKRSKNH